MKIAVELLSSTEEGLVRVVEIPDSFRDRPVAAVLEMVFEAGQNCITPQEMPSVSVGDVVQFRGRHLVAGSGFRLLDVEAYAEHRNMSRSDRAWKSLNAKAS